MQEDIKDVVMPDHECPGDETCGHPKMVMFLAYDDGVGGITTETVVHLLHPSEVGDAVVRIWDALVQDATHKDVPEYARFAFGREQMRKAVEETPPPVAVTEQLEKMAEGND